MDLIYRQDAIDALNKMKIYRSLDSDRYVISDCLNRIVNLPSAQSEPTTEIQKILNYLDTTIHPIVSPDNWYVYAELHDMVNKLPSAQPEQRWISCSERLPDDTTYENHLVVVYCTKSGTVDVGWYEAFFQKWWRLEPDEEIREEVIAWMPLPQTYTEK